MENIKNLGIIVRTGVQRAGEGVGFKKKCDEFDRTSKPVVREQIKAQEPTYEQNVSRYKILLNSENGCHIRQLKDGKAFAEVYKQAKKEGLEITEMRGTGYLKFVPKDQASGFGKTLAFLDKRMEEGVNNQFVKGLCDEKFKLMSEGGINEREIRKIEDAVLLAEIFKMKGPNQKFDYSVGLGILKIVPGQDETDLKKLVGLLARSSDEGSMNAFLDRCLENGSITQEQHDKYFEKT